jgi:hypothetical protein
MFSKGKTEAKLKELFLKIYYAKDADDLHAIVENDELLKNPKNWKPYGGNPNNFSTFENQQNHPISALVEKITNSIDSILIKQAKLNGIDPKGPNAPKTMEQAIETFYNVKNGNWEQVEGKLRRQIAEQIQVIATGDKQAPNITIFDRGEGQDPDNFENSFLSLHRGNKINVPFVQGKFNMGSTGSVVFCAGHRYQLIASKYCNELSEEKKSNDFGFTLVRRHILTDQEEETSRSTWYEYFTFDDKIARFAIDSLELDDLFKTEFVDGSLVKLYSYKLPTGSRSNITLDLWRDLNQFLYKPALPILMYEQRKKENGEYLYKANSLEKVMLGNRARIMVDDRSKKADTISMNRTHEFGTLSIEVHVFNHDVKKNEFVKEKAVVFTMNGQVQGFLPRSFISQELGLSMLRDTTLIHVDCTKFKKSFQQDLFMASRDRLKISDNTKVLIDTIKKDLRESEELKELNEQRKDLIMRENKDDGDLLEHVMNNIPVDEELLKLLSKDGDFKFLKRPGTSQIHTGSVKRKRKYPMSYYPTIFEIIGDDTVELEQGKKVMVKFETDADDEYFIRLSDQGEMNIEIEHHLTKKFDDYFYKKIEGPKNGLIKVTLEAKETLKVDDEIDLTFTLTSTPKNLNQDIRVKIIEPVKKEKQKKPEQKNPEKPSIPQPIKVYEESWSLYDWNGEDIVKIITEGVHSENLMQAIAINMDADVLKHFMKKNNIKSEQQVKAVKDKFFLNIYLHAMFLYGTMNKTVKTEEELQIELDEMIASMFKPYSSFLLSLNTDKVVLETLAE